MSDYIDTVVNTSATLADSDHMKIYFEIRNGILATAATPNRMETNAAVQSITGLNVSNNNEVGHRHDSDPSDSNIVLDQLKDDEKSFKVAVYTHIRNSTTTMKEIIRRLDVIEENQKCVVGKSALQRAIAAAPKQSNNIKAIPSAALSTVDISSLSSEAWAIDTNLGNHSRITVLWMTNYCDSLDSTNLFAITSSNRRTQKIPKIACNSKFIAAFPATRVAAEFIINLSKRQVKPMKLCPSLSSTASLSIVTSYGNTSCFTMRDDSFKTRPLALFFQLITITQHSFIPLLYGQDILVRKGGKCCAADCFDGCDKCVLEILRNTMSTTLTRARLMVNSYLTSNGYGFLCALPYIFAQNEKKSLHKIFSDSLKTLSRLNSFKKMYNFVRNIWREKESAAPFNLIKLPTDITEDQVKGMEEGSSKRDPLYRMLTALLRFYAVEFNNTPAIELIAGTTISYEFPMEGRPENVTIKKIDTLLPARITKLNIDDENEYEEFKKRAGRMVCDDKYTKMPQQPQLIINNEAKSKSQKNRKRTASHDYDDVDDVYMNKSMRRQDSSSSNNDTLYNRRSGILVDDDYGSMDEDIGIVQSVGGHPLIGKKTIRMSDNHEQSSDCTDSDD